MGIKFMEGFDSYASNTDVARYWASPVSPWTFTSNAGRIGGGGMVAATTGAIAFSSPNSIWSAGLNSGNPIGLMFWIMVSAAPASNVNFLQILAPDGGTQQIFKLSAGGAIELWSGANVLVQTGVTNVCDGNWHWVELYMLNTNAGATQKCFVDNITQWNTSLTPNPSEAATLDHFAFISLTSRTITIDDVVAIDNVNALSPQPSDMPLGARIITITRPSADSSTQFTRDSGTSNFSRVDESTPDSDTSYVQDNTSGHTDLYSYGGLGYTPATINGVMVKSVVKNPGAGTISCKNTCTSNGTSSDGSSTITPASYQVVASAYDQDPHTSAAWTPTNLAAATFGIKVA